MSKILTTLGVDHTLEDVKKDGNCFYHAVSAQLNDTISHSSLREIVSNNLNDDDVSLFNVINDTEITLSDLKKKVLETGKYCLWADSVEINALTRSAPRMGLIIFDEVCSVINKIECENKLKKKYLYLLRDNFHYKSINLSKKNKTRINNIMKYRSNYQVKRTTKKNKLIIQFFIIIPIWMIFVQFLNCTL